MNSENTCLLMYRVISFSQSFYFKIFSTISGEIYLYGKHQNTSWIDVT